MKPESYWLDTAPAFTDSPGEPGEGGRPDVCVVGGGYTGLSAAYWLARSGAKVTLVEAGGIAHEASGRNGGHCNNGLSPGYASVVAAFGAERARLMYHDFESAVTAVESLVREEAIDCDFGRCGKLKMAVKPGHYDTLARYYEAMHRDVDPGMELIGPERVREEIDTPEVYGALLQKTSAQLHPGRFGVGLAKAAQKHGARIHTNTRVTGLKRLDGYAHLVTTSRGAFEASRVFLATGASQDGPWPWLRQRIVPVGSFMVATEPLPKDVIARLMPKRRNYVTSREIVNYFRITPDDRLLFGGRARFAMSTPKIDLESGGILRATIARMFPALADVRLDYCWGGLVDMTRDRLPRAGERDGLYYSMGYSGHGVQIAVRMGEVMANLLGGRPVASPWVGLPWAAIPGHFGKPWFLPIVGAYYRAMDALT